MSESAMRILSVTAHPDDVELVCAGLLARLTSEGHSVTITHLARGDKGGEKGDDPSLMARIRWDEAESAARLVGAAHRGGWFDDLAIPADEQSGPPEAKLVHLLLEEAPDLILVPPLWDYHPDHRHASSFALSSIVIAASMESAFRPTVLFTDTIGSLDFVPDYYCDISAVMETKRSMLSAHASQTRWMEAHRGLNMPKLMASCAWYRGCQAGMELAECFSEAASHHATDRRLSAITRPLTDSALRDVFIVRGG